jgi:L-Ala-D/L-Glu epimerase
MNITEIHITQLTIPLIRPFITAVRRTECVDDVVVVIKTDSGYLGYGSAASTPAITGDSTESIINAIKSILGPQLIGRSIAELNLLLQMNNQAIVGNTSAKAAIDMALHDLFAQYCGLPLYKLLGGNTNSISSCITISLKAHESPHFG